MVVVMGEARGTPSYVSPVTMQSPRYGGCVSSFFHLFDWASAKRLSSTKRLPASKSEKGSIRSRRSGRADHGKSRKRHDEVAPATMRPPGVVARLMGLESLPADELQAHNERYRRSLPDHSISNPVLLQDLLSHDFQPSKASKSLRQRLFSKRATRHNYAARHGSFPGFRCRSEEWCISPAFVDIPQAQSRFMYAVTQKQKPFLSRLPASSVHGESIPELNLLQARSAGRDVLLQGWPLGGQHNVPRDLYRDGETSGSELQQGSESVGSKPTDSASSKPLLMNSKEHGRRRSSSWNGSDDSECTVDGPPSRHRRNSRKSATPSLQSVNRRSKPLTDNEIKCRGHRGSSRSPNDRQPLILPAENSRTSVSFASTGTSHSSNGEHRSVTSKPPPSASQGRGSKAGRSKSANNSPTKNAQGRTTTTTTVATTAAKVKSKEHLVRSPAMAPGKPPPDKATKAKGKAAPSPDSHSDTSRDRIHHLPKTSPHSLTKLITKSPQKLQRFTEKAGMQTAEDVADRLTARSNTNAEDMASQSDEPVKRASQAQVKSVDALFPLLPLEAEPPKQTDIRLRRPIDRVLFSPDFDFADFTNTGDSTQISMSPLIEYEELCDTGDKGDKKKWNSNAAARPLLASDEARGKCNVTVAEIESISVDSYPVCWEDDIVETILSGRCCERSCSGPSISSRSLTFSEEERNGDSWSSCASFNPDECESPRESPRTKFQVKEFEVEAKRLDQEPKSPPLQFPQKTLEESLVDEATGQPSPVSVLLSPFHDETCTTSESSPESMRQLSSEEAPNEDSDVPTVSNSDRIKQALIDISMFRIHDNTAFEHAAPREYAHPKDEERFIREVLSAANLLSSSPAWHNGELAMDPSLFDRLESEGGTLASGGLWRCDRKLLFDCVNEAFGANASRLWRFQWATEPTWRPRGQDLVVAVVKTIDEWRTLASLAIDCLVERDMSVHLGHWRFIAPEVGEVGVEIEAMVWKGILDDVVGDFLGCAASARIDRVGEDLGLGNVDVNDDLELQTGDVDEEIELQTASVNGELESQTVDVNEDLELKTEDVNEDLELKTVDVNEDLELQTADVKDVLEVQTVDVKEVLELQSIVGVKDDLELQTIGVNDDLELQPDCVNDDLELQTVGVNDDLELPTVGVNDDLELQSVGVNDVLESETVAVADVLES